MVLAKRSAKEFARRDHVPGRSFGDLARCAVRQLRLTVLLFAAVLGASLFAAQHLPTDYRSSAVLIITAREADLTPGATNDAATRSALVDAGVEGLNSTATLAKIAADLKTKTSVPGLAKVSANLADVLKAHRRGQSYLVDVEARAPTAEAARAIVEAAVVAYQERQLDERFAALGVEPAPPAAAAKPDAAADLARLEAERAALADGIVVQAAPPVDEAAAVRARAALAQARADAAAVKALLRSEVGPSDVAAFQSSSINDRLGEDGAALGKELGEYLAAINDPGKADEAKFHKYQILTEATRLAPTLEAKVTKLAAEAATAASPGSAPPSPEEAARLKQLDLQIEAQRNFIAALAAAPSTPASPKAASTPGDVNLEVRLVSAASLGAAATWRQPHIYVAAAFALAILVSLAFLIARTMSANTVLDGRDAAMLAGAPLVAAAPSVRGWQLRRLAPSERHAANAVIEQPASPFADAMREALSVIRPAAGRSEGVCVAIVGVQAGDGASTVSLALARMAAAGGLRVLVIDTDFAEAGLTKAMGIEPAAGTESMLGGDRQLGDLVVEDDMTSAHLLPCAPTPTSRGALSLSQLNAFKTAITAAKAAYELIILDCQPNSTRARTRSMSRMADVALIVAAYDRTRRDALGAMAARTQQSGASLAGVVFNMAPERSRRTRFEFASEANTAGFAPLFTTVGPAEADEVRSIH